MDHGIFGLTFRLTNTSENNCEMKANLLICLSEENVKTQRNTFITFNSIHNNNGFFQSKHVLLYFIDLTKCMKLKKNSIFQFMELIDLNVMNLVFILIFNF